MYTNEIDDKKIENCPELKCNKILNLQQELTDSYREKKLTENSFDQGEENQLLYAILDSFEGLKSNEYFLLYFRNNQVWQAYYDTFPYLTKKFILPNKP